MKNKDEQIADARLKQLGVTPRIYHFVKNVEPFTAITIAEDVLTLAGARRELDLLLRYDIAE